MSDCPLSIEDYQRQAEEYQRSQYEEAQLPPKAAGSVPAFGREPNLIARFQQDVEKAGLVGEKKNACIVFLAALSARLDKPLHVTIQGSSSAGGTG